MRRRSRALRSPAAPPALVIALALALGFATAGCGGGDEGDDEPSGPDASSVLACAQDHGLNGVSTAGDEALGTGGGLTFSLPPDNTITVDFFTDPDAAETYSEGQATFLGGAGGRGTSEVAGGTTVISASHPGAEKQVALIEGCLD